MRLLLILSSLVFFALLVFLLIQNTVLVSLNDKNAMLKIQSTELDFQYKNEDFRKATMEKLLTLGSKFMKNKERMVARLLQKLEKKKTENGTCQADKKKKAVELARIQNKHKKIKVALKKESDAWKEEINTLTAQLFGHRAICNYVRNNTIAVKLCTRKLLDPALKKEPRRNKP